MDDPEASCRMCFVEIEGEKNPLCSCKVPAREGMVIKTDTNAVRRLQRTGLKLLLSAHDVNCRECPSNKNCDLQRLAKFLKVGLKPKRLETCFQKVPPIQQHPFLDYFPNRCILCGKCIFICRKIHDDKPCLTFAKRGLKTTISLYGKPDDFNSPCNSCFACTEICPVSALTLKKQNYLNG